MAITIENNNDVIVYALEKIISYTRDNQYIFLAQTMWWISSIIGLQQGLIVHIDNLKVRSELPSQEDRRICLASEAPPQAQESDHSIDTNRYQKEVAVTPRDIQEDPRSPHE